MFTGQRIETYRSGENTRAESSSCPRHRDESARDVRVALVVEPVAVGQLQVDVVVERVHLLPQHALQLLRRRRREVALVAARLLVLEEVPVLGDDRLRGHLAPPLVVGVAEAHVRAGAHVVL